MRTKQVRTPSLSKGALAGLIGGLVGAAAKSMVERILSPKTDGHAAPPLLAERASDDLHQSLNDSQEAAAVAQVDWVFGGLSGAAYGAIVESNPEVAAWQGAAFGIALNKMTHEGALAAIVQNASSESQESQQSQTTPERYSERATHVVFGVVTELVRRLVRSRL